MEERKRTSCNILGIYVCLCFFLFAVKSYTKQILSYEISLPSANLEEVLEVISEAYEVEVKTDQDLSLPLEVYFNKGENLTEALRMIAEASETTVQKKGKGKYFLHTESPMSRRQLTSEEKGESRDFVLKYLNSKEAVNLLKDLYGEGLRISSLGTQNRIFVNASPSILEGMEEVLKKVDLPPKQVRVEMQILDVSSDLFHELGFDWLYEKPARDSKQLSVSMLREQSSSNLGSMLGSQINLVRQFANATEALGLSFRLLEANHDLRVSSSPSLVIRSGSEGEFKITEELIVGEKRQKLNEKDVSVEPIFKEAGLILKVRPEVHEDDSVTLEVQLELSDFRYQKGGVGKEGWSFNAQGGSKIGRSLTTKLEMGNRQSIVLGALHRKTQQDGENKVPFLGDIPIVRYLFRNERKKVENTDMYMKLSVEVY